jgi:hypothetical protein
MRRRTLAGAATAAVMLASAMQAGHAAAQATVDTFSNFAWRDIAPSACLDRAAQSMGPTLTAFGVVSGEVSANNLRVLGRTSDLNVFVYCFADDETAALDGATARRVLVAIYVSTSRGPIGGDIRNYLAQCMETGACPPGAANAIAPGRVKP